MAIFNTNEFLRKTFSKTIFGTAALRPEAVCADGFTLSIQASGMHYCIPNEDLSDGNYSKVELSYLSEEVEEFLPFAEDDEALLATVYGYVPVETVDAVLAKHGGIVNVFEYTESPMLNIKKFPEMSDEWLDFIAICRSGKHHDYDIVEGPMADDTIWNYVNDFLSGDISREAFWALAKFKHPTHQISFHTEVALKSLSFKEAIEV